MTAPVDFPALDLQLRDKGFSADHPSPEARETVTADLKRKFRAAVLTFASLAQLFISPRPLLLGDWFAEGDLGFLFAKRGVGKTWFGLLIAVAIALGRRVGPWLASAGKPVLYVDGEMPLDLMQKRSVAMTGDCSNLHFLQHEHVADTTEAILNLTDGAAQQAVTDLCIELGIKVLVLDNLSCLFRGVAENEADEWEKILPWLLELRRRHIAVLFICHAGRNSQMRGTSRREDAASWIIRLDDAGDSTTAKTDTKFTSTFTKPSRNSPVTPPPLRWTLATRDGALTVGYEEAEGTEVVLKWIRDGLVTATDIAQEMGVSKGQVSKLASILITAGRVRKKGREYEFIDDPADRKQQA